MEFVLLFLVLLYSAILHEIAHGFVAYHFGDPTAKLRGRLTLNPIRHLDLFYSFLLPLGLFLAHFPVIGGAKPVPVDPFNLKDVKKDYALISLAGPLTNLILVMIGSIIAHIAFPHASLFELHELGVAGLVLYTVIQINLALGIFNLLPIPPLDGSKLFAMLLPDHAADRYLSFGTGPTGFFLLVFLFYIPLGPFSLGNIIGLLMNASLPLLGF
jgi:Zn-dependent protease